MRVGIGYDVHRFAPERKLMLGCVEIPYAMGLLGHSDADVLVHAVCDALLGAAGLGDIGEHFPDHDPKYKDVSGKTLLRETTKKIRRARFAVVNVDCIVFAEKPRISPYREDMRKQLAETMGIVVGSVNVKATTTEGLGYIGRGEGIAAMATALLE